MPDRDGAGGGKAPRATRIERTGGAAGPPPARAEEEDLPGLLDFVEGKEAMADTAPAAMPAYVIMEADVGDPIAYEEYKRLSAEAVRKHGARYLVRGGAVHALEGDWRPRRMVIVEFPSVEAAKAFYDSPEYNIARDMRRHAAKLNVIIVEGVPGE